jgi:hypothetical protein
MDHSQALRNAAKSVGAECVVYCYIYVDRGAMKKRAMKNRGRRHNSQPTCRWPARDQFDCCLESSTKPYLIVGWILSSRGGGVMARKPLQTGSNLCTWRRIGMTVHSTSGLWWLSRSCQPQLVRRAPLHHNQCDEPLFWVLQRVIKTKATTAHFFGCSVPCSTCYGIWRR